MIEVWYDVYNGSDKVHETQSKAEAIAHVLAENNRLRTKHFTYRLRRHQVNPVALRPAPSFYS